MRFVEAKGTQNVRKPTAKSEEFGCLARRKSNGARSRRDDGGVAKVSAVALIASYQVHTVLSLSAHPNAAGQPLSCQLRDGGIQSPLRTHRSFLIPASSLHSTHRKARFLHTKRTKSGMQHHS